MNSSLGVTHPHSHQPQHLPQMLVLGRTPAGRALLCLLGFGEDVTIQRAQQHLHIVKRHLHALALDSCCIAIMLTQVYFENDLKHMIYKAYGRHLRLCCMTWVKHFELYQKNCSLDAAASGFAV